MTRKRMKVKRGTGRTMRLKQFGRDEMGRRNHAPTRRHESQPAAIRLSPREQSVFRAAYRRDWAA